jgi:multisubunit Na+/H+ antiporter MnhB subunit
LKRTIGTIVGLLVGLLASYLFRPSVPFLGTVSFSEWFSADAFNAGYGSTIITCGVIGAVVGFTVGLLAERKPASPAA